MGIEIYDERELNSDTPTPLLRKLQGFASRMRPHHVLYCNADHSKPVGCDMCICLQEPADAYYPHPDLARMREALERIRDHDRCCTDWRAADEFQRIATAALTPQIKEQQT